jgi:hypothetical protein
LIKKQIGEVIYMNANGIPANQGGYAQLCVYVSSGIPTSGSIDVYSDLSSAWLTTDSSAPTPVQQLNVVTGRYSAVVNSAGNVCIDLDVNTQVSVPFMYLSNLQRQNGLMINYRTSSESVQKVSIEPFQSVGFEPYIRYVRCKSI